MANSRKKVSLLPLFFLSGITGLLYQISWIRESSLIFGSTLAAMSSVTAIFFGGMALGNWYISREKRKNRLHSYGKVQIAIALSALLTFPLFHLFKSVPAFGALGLDPTIMTLYRLMALALIIGPASFFSGATFPLMIAITPTDDSHIASNAAKVYGVNSLGAVIGTLLCGIVLIPSVGIIYSILIAVIMNLLIATRVFLLPDRTLSEEIEESSSDDKIKIFPALLLFFSTGFTGMGAEIIWSRFLSLVIHNTVYTYTITIATVIIGIAIGAIVAGKIADKIKNYATLFAGATLLTSTTMLIALYLPATFWQSVTKTEDLVVIIPAIMGLMFIPALFSGATFPLVLKMAVPHSAQRSKGAGNLMAINTIGGITGSLIMGFLLLPSLGLVKSIMVVAGIQITTAFLALCQKEGDIRKWLLLLLPCLALPLLRSPKLYMKQYLAPNQRLVYLNEGKLASVTVLEHKGLRTMEIDRLWQGENRKTRQIMAAHLPMLLSNGAKDALVIGVGVGLTAERFLMYNIDSLHCLDIEESVFDAAEEYFDASWLSTNPKVKKIVADGRTFIQHSSNKYDLISIEIGQIFRPYSATFYTEDFYKSVHNRLSDKGVVSQFIPIASFNFEQFQTAIRTFLSVFPEAQMWYNKSEFLLIGYKDRVGTFDDPYAQMYLQPNNKVYEDLEFNYWGGEEYSLNRKNILAANYLYGPKELQNMVGDGPIYNDNRPVLEYQTARKQSNEPFISDLEAHVASIADILPESGHPKIIKGSEFVRDLNMNNLIAEPLIREYSKTDNPIFLEEAAKYNSYNLYINHELGTLYFKQKKLKEALVYLSRAYKLAPDNMTLAKKVATLYLNEKKPTEAIKLYSTILTKDSSDHVSYNNLGMAFLQTKQLDKAYGCFAASLQIEPTYKRAKDNIDYLANYFEKVENARKAAEGTDR